MENIESILKSAGVELTPEQTESISKAVGENYKPIADYQKQKDKIANLTDQLTATKESLKKFEGVDAESLNKQIADLTKALADKDAEFEAKNAERDFMDSVKSAITKAHGKDADMIAKLLDLDALRKSQDRSADIDAAIKTLTESEITKGMFEVSEPPKGGARTNPIGRIGSAPAAEGFLDEKYKNNPYYHKK